MTVPEFDVIVIGGGIAGVSAGASLAAAQKVLVIEAESQPGYHASGRSAAYFAPAYGNAAVRLMTLDSQDFYQAPPVEFAKDLLKPRGAVFLARQNELDLLEDMASEQPELERVSAEAIRAQVPIIHSDVVGGLFDPIGGDLDVHAILQGYLKQLRVRGGTFQTDARVLGLDRVGEHWQVRCRDGLVASAKIIVNAAGAWADEVGLLAGLPPLGLQPKRRTACLIEVPKVFNHADWPMCVGIQEDFYFKAEGAHLLVSPADETPSAPCDAQPEDFDIALAIDRFHSVCDLPVDRIQSRWAGLRTFAPDGNFVVGADPRLAGYYWFAGQGGYGFQSAPAMADLICRLVRKEAVLGPQAAILAQLAPARLVC